MMSIIMATDKFPEETLSLYIAYASPKIFVFDGGYGLSNDSVPSLMTSMYSTPAARCGDYTAHRS